MNAARILTGLAAVAFCLALAGCGGGGGGAAETPANPLPPPTTGPSDAGLQPKVTIPKE